VAGVLTWTEYVVQNQLKARREEASPRGEKPSPSPREGESDEGQSPRERGEENQEGSPSSDKGQAKAKGEDVKYTVDADINGKVSLWRGDITRLEIDAIVNAANKFLERGGGVCGCIHEAAGDELQDECDTLDGCPEGSSKLTRGYALPAKHVIHTVGPMGEKPAVLKSAYNSALKLMLEKNFKAIAFPCISTGIYGYPPDRAAIVAMSTVREFLEKHKDKVDRIIFATFLPKDVKIYEEGMQIYFPTE
jgi:O-acetyl-ADP-ribose deacetylase (regulator of RNase III)